MLVGIGLVTPSPQDQPATASSTGSSTTTTAGAEPPAGPSAEEAAAKAEADQLAGQTKAAEDAAKAEADRAEAQKQAAAAAQAEATKGTLSQQNAYDSAKDYLEFKGFSRSGLLKQLSSDYGDGYPATDAEFAVARLETDGEVDWNQQAAAAAKSYLELQSFSRTGLLEQLTSDYGDGFTPAQAEYGVNSTGL